MNFFVTGHKGYIGSHLVALIKQAGHQVTGCDIGLFSGTEWETLTPPDVDLVQDIRTLTPEDLVGHDCVMHLAAISNDPMGELTPTLTESVNFEGSVHLAKIAKQAGVPRYLFASSCSIYGQGETLGLDETATFNPLTAYAHSKVNTEAEVSKLADDTFSPVFLRNATAYGHSPVLRIDLVVNNLLGCALARGDIRIQSDGSPWRPLVHCKDIARAFLAFANAPRERIHNQAVNVGGNAENYQVKDVADNVQKLVPNANIVYTGEVGADPRNYRVNFDKLKKVLPDFTLAYTLSSGMDELYHKMQEHKFSQEDFEGEQFVRLKILKKRLNMLQTEQGV